MKTPQQICDFIRTLYADQQSVPLHVPVIEQLEKDKVMQALDSGFVSSVGPAVVEFEKTLAEYCGAKFCIAMNTGTAALHIALLTAGVKPGDLVITQAISFVATANAIAYCGAEPVFLDCDRDRLSLCPDSLQRFLSTRCQRVGEHLVEASSQRVIKAVVPMHTFGHSARIVELQQICQQWGLSLVEDAAEALGSFNKNQHLGTFGQTGVLSFNGNKTITCGAGGALLTNDEQVAEHARHLSTTAKQPHAYRYYHDQVGFNYRQTNLHAALGLAQLQRLPEILTDKKHTAACYREFFEGLPVFIDQPKQCSSNFWLNAIVMESAHQAEALLEFANQQGIQLRPIWTSLAELPMYRHCISDDLVVTQEMTSRIVNLPSSIKEGEWQD